MTDAQWVEHWRRIGPELERICRAKLRTYDHAENWPAIDALLQMGFERRVVRNTSGLVELQRRLARSRT